MTLRVAVVGAGLIGTRRAASAASHPGSHLELVVDLQPERAAEVGARHGCRSSSDWQSAVADPAIDAVVVSVINRDLAPISIAALGAGKHVLCEKPPGRNLAEAQSIADAASASGLTFKAGFNLRFQPAIRDAHAICAAGGVGETFFLRAVYGHGGRAGYEQEWRGDRELAGGGELLDQGVHLLDLATWFLGELRPAAALTRAWHWGKGELEDNAFMLLESPRGQAASLHTSWTQWRNRFSFEVFGEAGYVRVEGLGGSYGISTLVHGRRRPESGPPDEEVREYPGADPSWAADWDDFVTAAVQGRPPEVGPAGAVEVMELVDAVYALARQAPRAAAG